MNCPACKNVLSERSVSNIKIDVCDNGCGGMWFDNYEMKKFDEALEPDAETLLNLKVDSNKKVLTDSDRSCPKCKTFGLMKNFSNPKRTSKIDVCPNCAGVWLDAGELIQIRKDYGTEKEKIAAAEQLFDQTFGNAMKEEKQKTKNLGKMFKFVLPSYFRNK